MLNDDVLLMGPPLPKGQQRVALFIPGRHLGALPAAHGHGAVAGLSDGGGRGVAQGVQQRVERRRGVPRGRAQG